MNLWPQEAEGGVNVCVHTAPAVALEVVSCLSCVHWVYMVPLKLIRAAMILLTQESYGLNISDQRYELRYELLPFIGIPLYM